MQQPTTWQGVAERLDRVLPELGLARSRSQAAEFIARGDVRVDGVIVTKAGARVAPDSTIEVAVNDHYVSRAAHKLLAGLDAFHVDPRGQLALDVGASTGGFTQVLLERGARSVLAIDVGHGQLVDTLRDDPRVRVVEGCNARDLTPDSLATSTGVLEAPEIVVGDVSFISLSLVLPALSRVAAQNAQFILLIKPQFEVGRQGIQNGIVTDPRLAIDAVTQVIRFADSIGLGCRAVAAAPITGQHGNQEVLAHFVRGHSTNPTEWEGVIRDLFEPGGEA